MATMGRPLDAVGRAAAWCSCVLGLGSAGVSAYWALGGTALLDTVGGSLEEWGRERSFVVVTVLAAVAVVKVGVAIAAPVVTGAVNAPAWATARAPRVLSWVAAVVLTAYGGLLTATGLVVQAGIIEPGSDADRHALAWHTWFWDPWFLLWGLVFVIALVRCRITATNNRRGLDTPLA
jgi:uncharacterized protein DUF3995